jgi:hypothetical protein
MTSAPHQPARDTGSGASDARSGYEETGSVPRQPSGYEESGRRSPARTGAVAGLTLMAAVLMMVSGVWGFFEGLAAIIRGGFFVVTSNYVYSMSVTGWGWIHLVLGVILFVAGACLLADMLWARITGVVIASLSAVANFLFIPYYPVWSIVLIALDLFVIWALLTGLPSFAGVTP